MENQFLDEDLLPNKNNNIQSKILSWTSIVILWLGVGFSLSFGYLTNHDLAAIILLAIVSLICKVNFEIGVKVTFGLILAGVFNLVDFLPIKYEMGFGTSAFAIRIDLILFLVLVIHYLTNKQYFAKYLDFIYKDTIAEDNIKPPSTSRINNFKKRFANKDAAELEAISENNKLIREANIAAEELLKEKDFLN